MGELIFTGFLLICAVILLISSELPEIFGVCDRILVMREGKIKADLVTAETTPEEVMKFASGSMN